MHINPDLGTFAPLHKKLKYTKCAKYTKNRIFLHRMFMHMRINAKIFVFLYILSIYQLKKFYKQYISNREKNLTFFGEDESFNGNILENFSPSQKKSQIFSHNQIWQFIHQSKALVELSRNMLFIKLFELIYGQKIQKNRIFLHKLGAQKSLNLGLCAWILAFCAFAHP